LLDIVQLLAQIATMAIDGVTFGLQLAIIAVGVTIIFGQGEIINISHGEAVVLMAITAALLSPVVGLLIGILVGIGISALFGGFIYSTVLKPSFKLSGDQRILSGLFITIGLYLALHGYFTSQFSMTYLSIRLPFSLVEVGDLSFRFSSIISAFISLVLLLLLWAFLRYTMLGKAIRATAQNDIGARLAGVSIDRIRLLTFVIGYALACSAGVARAISASIGAGLGIELTILALLVCVVGGIRSVFGTIVAGIILGTIYTITSYLVGAYLSNIIMLIATALTILFRPEGILGEIE